MEDESLKQTKPSPRGRKYKLPAGEKPLTEKSPIFISLGNISEQIKKAKSKLSIEKMFLATCPPGSQSYDQAEKKVKKYQRQLERLKLAYNIRRGIIISLAAGFISGAIVVSTFYAIKSIPSSFETLWAQKVPEANSNDPNVVINEARELLHENFVKENGLNIDPSMIGGFADKQHHTPTLGDPDTFDLTRYSLGIVKRDKNGNIIRDPSGSPDYAKTFYEYTQKVKYLGDGTTKVTESGEIPSQYEKYQAALQLIAEAQRKQERGEDALSAAQAAFQYVATMEIHTPRTDTDPEDIKHMQENGSLPSDISYRFDEDGFLVNPWDDGR